MITFSAFDQRFIRYANYACKLGLTTGAVSDILSLVFSASRYFSHRPLAGALLIETLYTLAPIVATLRYRFKPNSLRRLLTIWKVGLSAIGVQLAWLMWNITYVNGDNPTYIVHFPLILFLFLTMLVLMSIIGMRLTIFVRQFAAYKDAGCIRSSDLLDIVQPGAKLNMARTAPFTPGIAAGIASALTIGIGVAETGRILFVISALIISPFLLGLAVAQHITLLRTIGDRDLIIM